MRTNLISLFANMLFIIRRNGKLKCLPIVVTIFLILYSFSTFGQISVTTPYPVAAQPLTRGLDTSLLTVEVNFTSSCTGNTATITLPTGVTYVPGSVTAMAGTTSGFGISDAGGTANAPKFNITGVAGPGSIRFSVKRTAGCGAAASGKDVISVTGSCGSATEADPNINSYNLLSPALALTPPASITNAVVGTTATRTTTVTNGGNGALDTLRFYIVYPGGGIINTSGTNTITANATTFTPSTTNGDTLFYKIYGATLFGGNNLLGNGETVTITEPIKVVKCNATTAYGAGWGRTQSVGGQCQKATGTSNVAMANGVPNASVAVSIITNTLACTPGVAKVTFTSTGTANSAGAIYNVVGSIASNNGGGQPGVWPNLSLSNFLLNNTTPITSTFTSPNFKFDFSQFTTDPDGAGVGLDDLDGDGQFDDLPAGQSVSIYLTQTYTPGAACVSPSFNGGVYSTITYNNMCKSTSGTISNVNNPFQFTVQALNVSLPAVVVGGSPFTMRICQTGSSVNMATLGTDSLVLEMQLPAGITYVPGSSLFNGVSSGLTTTQVGSTLYIRRKGTVGDFCFELQMMYTCGSSGNVSLPYSLYYVRDRSCNAIDYYTCNNPVIPVKCPIPCADGIANNPTIVRRVNYGWKFSTMTEKVDTSTLSLFSKKTATIKDTINITQGGKQIGSYSSLHYYMQLDKAAGSNVLKYVSGTLFYKAAGSAAVLSCDMPSPANESTSTSERLHWDLTFLLGGACGLPPTLATGDSVWADMRFTVTAAYSSTALMQPTGANCYFYNLAAAGQVYCDQWPIDLYVIDNDLYGLINTSAGPTSFSACAPSDLLITSLRGASYLVADLFPNEFRPMLIKDSLAVTLPDGYSWSGGNCTLTRDTFSTVTNRVSQTFVITPIVNGNKLSFINPGNWPVSDMMPVINARLAFLSIPLIPNCAAATTSKIIVSEYGKRYTYAGLAEPYSRTNNNGPGNLTLSYSPTTKPSVSVQNNTGVVQGILPQHYWDVQINNPSTQTAPYLWLALEKSSGSGGISIDSVVLKTSNVILAASAYNNTDKWYQVNNAGLTSGSSQQARVYFKYSSCTDDSILLRSGWNCTGYPSPDPLTGYACSAAQTYLKVVPQNSQVQIEMKRQPGNGGTINLCTPDSVTVIVNSAQAANLVNPNVVIYPPTGITLSPQLQVEYPLSSGNWQNITPVSIAGGGYQVNLNNHTGIATNGLPGTASNPASDGRQAKIRVAFSADCSVVSGSQFDFFAHGFKPCNAPASGDGLNVKSDPVNITGAATVGSAAITQALSGASAMECGDVRTINSGVTTVGTDSKTGDTAEYKIPAGMIYAPGSFGGCASCTVTIAAGIAGSTIVKVSLPTGVAAGTPINFSFGVTANSGAGCNTLGVTGQVTRIVGGLKCNGIDCASSKVIIGTTGAPLNFTINKPNLTIVNAIKTAGSFSVGGTATVAVFVRNTGVVNAPAATYMVEIFCGNSTTPFSLGYFPTAVPAGALVSGNMTFTVPNGSCTNGQYVTYKIRPVTSLNQVQCMCNETSFTNQEIALPITLVSFTAKAETCNNVVLNWKVSDVVNFHFFELERSIDGTVFQKAGAVLFDAATLIYSFKDMNLATGNYQYRLKLIDNNGTFKYSSVVLVRLNCNEKVVILYPNPTRGSVTISGLKGGELIQLYAVNGQLLISKKALGYQEQLDLTRYAAGTYNVIIRNESERLLITKVIRVQE